MKTKQNDLSKSELQMVADLHKAQLTEGFLAQLGTELLAMIYEGIQEFDQGVLITKWENGQLAGFVSGVEDMGAFYRYFTKKYTFRGGWLLVVKLLNPSRLQKIWEVMRHGRREQAGESDYPAAELTSIAIADNYKGKGVASELYNELKEIFKQKEIKRFKIVVGQKLVPANRFYKKMGALQAGEIEVHKGARSWVYIQETG